MSRISVHSACHRRDEGFRHTNKVLGDQSGEVSALYEEKRFREAKRKHRERSKTKTNGPPADFMTLTCSTCSRQFRARIGLVSHQRTHQHT